MTNTNDKANGKPFELWLHPVEKDSEHNGKKQNIGRQAAQEAISSLLAKPFKASHYSKGEFNGAFTGGELLKRVDKNNEEWVKAKGVLWSGEELEDVDFISSNKDDIGISYEIVPLEFEEDDSKIKVNKYLYKSVVCTEKGENAFPSRLDTPHTLVR